MTFLQTFLILASLMIPSKSYSGNMAHYGPGTMERVCRIRQDQGFNFLCEGAMFASAWEPLGTTICVFHGNRTVCGIVVDVCDPKDCQAQRKRNLVAEADWNTAQFLFPELKKVGGLSERESKVTIEVYGK